jgi:thiol-disulfide isomerase/thioredoxin
MNLFERYNQGLEYGAFIERYATDVQKERWRSVEGQVFLSEAQRSLLRSFKRKMPVLCLAGAWCGDCINQCPIFARFAAEAPDMPLRFLDRDEHADVQEDLRICGGKRVPVLVFFSEDGFEIARYGERTLSKYRQLMQEQTGPACPTGIHVGKDPMLVQVTQDWLNELERVQWILRLSPRLRQLYND